MLSSDKKYIYKGKNGRYTELTYNFQGLNQIRGIYDNDPHTGFVIFYDQNDTLYDLNIESTQKGGGTNLLFALIDFCYALRQLKGIEIHYIKGDISSLDRDQNREIYREIYEDLKETYPDIGLKYYDYQNNLLPLDDAAYLSKYKGKVRHFEFFIPWKKSYLSKNHFKSHFKS